MAVSMARARIRAIQTRVVASQLRNIARSAKPRLSDESVLDAKTREKRRAEFPPARHPMVRTNPDTGKKILYVNSIFTSHIEGMDADESERLLDLLYRQATVPEYQCRFHWEPGSVALWDNRCTHHFALNDYHGYRRHMHRCTIEGDRPS